MPAVTRFFDHIQSSLPIRSSAAFFSDSYSIILFSLQNAPKLERSLDASKKKDKSPKTITETVAETVPTLYQHRDKGKKKERGELETTSTPATNKKQGKAAAEDDGDPVPSMIDLRVGRIVDSTLFFASILSQT